jgi:hypothetical protein
MAAPIVTGIIALAMSIKGKKFSHNIKDKISRTSRKFESFYGKVSSNGVIDAYGLLSGQASLDFNWD